MQYRITIEEAHEESDACEHDYQKVQYREVYKQTVEDLDVMALVAGINGPISLIVREPSSNLVPGSIHETSKE